MQQKLIYFLIIILLTSCERQEDKHLERPEENRFKRTVITEDLSSPMAFEVSADGKIYLIESGGNLKIIEPKTGKSIIAGTLKLFDPTEFGLIGMALDPGFLNNHWIYFQYGVPSTKRDSMRFQVSRFTINADSIDFSSEKKLVQVPYVYACCHTAGSMTFDSKGNLYFSTGDNTNAFETTYSPSDERPGHEIANALRSAANSMDLRGKILRIHPEPDGTYTIPKDNLFADGKNGRPEVYVMGCRNPYRIYVDKKTDILYWGEVGPDAEKDSTRGPRGHDEFNIAKKAGFFGWPLFIGNNKPYKKMNFETGEIVSTFDAGKPVNFSRLNSGVRDLPPANPAVIWYPYDTSKEFPSFGLGGRTAIGGPLYHFDPDSKSKEKFPEYFDGCWFISDWMRNWVKAVHFDSEQKITMIDSLLPSSAFKKPIYMSFGGDGILYMIEYGSNWFGNTDSRLAKIEYIAGNRPPIAEISAEKEYGALPFTVKLSAKHSTDADKDSLKYQWELQNGKIISEMKNLSYKLEQPGKYDITLTVSDSSGASNAKSITVYAGNDKPEVKIAIPNESFYWESLPYSVSVSDKEDGVLGKEILPSQVQVALTPMPRNTILSGSGNEKFFQRGEVLVNESDCKGCHSLDAKSVGPSFAMVSKKYENTEKNISTLAEKILRGGNGSWGNQAMAAHPQLTKAQTSEMVRYILSLSKPTTPSRKLDVSGTLSFPWNDIEPGKEKSFLLTASYTDKAHEQTGGRLTGSANQLLRFPKFYADDFEDLFEANIRKQQLLGRIGSYGRLSGIDLANIKQIVLKAGGHGVIELRLDDRKGPLLGVANIDGGDTLKTFAVDVSAFAGPPGKRNIYFIRKTEKLRFNEYAIEWVYFSDRVRKEW